MKGTLATKVNAESCASPAGNRSHKKRGDDGKKESHGHTTARPARTFTCLTTTTFGQPNGPAVQPRTALSCAAARRNASREESRGSGGPNERPCVGCDRELARP